MLGALLVVAAAVALVAEPLVAAIDLRSWGLDANRGPFFDEVHEIKRTLMRKILLISMLTLTIPITFASAQSSHAKGGAA
jgi:hypothetical protein